MQETWVHPLEKEMATHSSTLTWRIPWTGEPGGSPWGYKESDMTELLTPEKLEVLAVLDLKITISLSFTLSAEVLITIYSLHCVDWYCLPAVFVHDNWKAWGVSGTRYRKCSHSLI